MQAIWVDSLHPSKHELWHKTVSSAKILDMKHWTLLIPLMCVALTQCHNSGKPPFDIQDSQYGIVRIARDNAGVPGIGAENREGLAYGLGWMHACDRQFQSILTIIGVTGRISEFAKGDELIEIDRQMKKLNLVPDPDEEIRRLEPEVRSQLQAYADGFNDYISGGKKSLILKLMGYDFEPWTIKESLITAKLFSYAGATQYQEHIERLIIQMIRERVGERRIRELFPAIKENIDADMVEMLRETTLADQPVPENVPWNPRFSGTNAWAISGKKTESGAPIVCGDLHQDLNRLPAIWYEAVLVLPDDTLAGATIPGLPGIIVGRNAHLAWSPASSMMDMVDLRVEQIKDGKYRRGDSWIELEVREEKIQVKKGDPIIVRFYETDDGVLDVTPDADGYYLSRVWSVQSKAVADDFNAILNLQTATTVSEAMQLLRQMSSSPFVWVLADDAGNIGCQMSGRALQRASGASGLVPSPAWEPEHNYGGFVEKRDLPSAYNPPGGFVIAANNDLNHLGQIDTINLPDSSLRADRAARLISEETGFNAKIVKRMQYDVYSPLAEQYMEIIGPLLPESENGAILRAWDYRYDLESKGAALFELVRMALIREVFGEYGFGREIMEYLTVQSQLLQELDRNIDHILLSSDSSWFGGRGREEIYQIAIEKGLDTEAKALASSRKLTFYHMLFGGRIPSFLGFDYRPKAIPGGREALYAIKVHTDQKREIVQGPSFRMIADLGTDEVLTNLPGGPSDRRFSKWYKSDIENSLNGVYKALR